MASISAPDVKTLALQPWERNLIGKIKKAQKNEGMSEDTEKEAEAEVQEITDKNVKKVDEIVAAKEKEILKV